jgi:hypothetical protein
LPTARWLAILAAETDTMPIYEFYSPDTNKIYSFLARSLAYAAKTPRCPDGQRYRMEKLISSFAVVGRAQEKPVAPAGPADAQMDAAMQAMEREFAGMDEANPDPRQMGRMMRRMAELTGEKMPAEMQEMVRRLEAGEDPEKLEAEYGDALGEPAGDQPERPADEKPAAHRRVAPVRDATLYDMAGYVD